MANGVSERALLQRFAEHHAEHMLKREAGYADRDRREREHPGQPLVRVAIWRYRSEPENALMILIQSGGSR